MLLILLIVGLSRAAKAQILTAEQEIAAGVAAIEAAKIDTAVEHFRRAVALNPNSATAHLALAATADLYSFAASSNPDMPLGELAISEYKKVLDLDPQHLESLKGLAYLLLILKSPKEAEVYYRKGLELQPDDVQLLCGLGATSFRQVVSEVVNAKIGAKLPLASPLIDSSSCNPIRSRIEARVVEGVELFTKALKIRSDADFMGYLCALHLAKADLQCGDRKAFMIERKAAKRWNRKRILVQKTTAYLDFDPKCPPPPPPLPYYSLWR